MANMSLSVDVPEVGVNSPQTTAKNFSSPLDQTTLSLAYRSFEVEIEYFYLVFQVLNLIEKYGRHVVPQAKPGLEDDPEPPSWVGKMKFLPHVYHFVRERQPVQLTLPAFPCKSFNRVSKVLGHLPDLGEELSLLRLNALCQDIQRVYAPGATVTIATDGALFNDILGISDEDCWDYGEALKEMISDLGLKGLRLIRPINLLGLVSEEDTTRETYLATVNICRDELDQQFGFSEDRLAAEIKKDRDTELTYCGMVKFLELEVQTSSTLAGLTKSAQRRMIKSMAKKMIQRSEAFTLAIRTLRPHDVRLSIHPSSGAAKLSFPLIPGPDGGFQKSPWHSCLAVGLDGNYRCVHSKDVDQTHELVYRDGRPYFYREKLPLYNWGMGVLELQPRYYQDMSTKTKTGGRVFSIDHESFQATAAAAQASAMERFLKLTQ
ncbi:hypothetical protein BO71DRAFT_395009 [Aspergillus ellipticus CBS 707.79]|uniref:Pyoverdine/dityrosine biosynthesis protein n=1 Tax=Aspergillus ellipticus CBS 707.79 TaxID=1448320 RepID=A0A319DPU6_9EURO|nr:hypothetical protein BO71DRAFT_395009 [Aspergillus ellipticus CBS 707.79]